MLEKFYLWIDNKYQQKISEQEARAFREILQRFVQSYATHKDTMTLQQWLSMKLQKELPQLSTKEAENLAYEMIAALQQTESKRLALSEAKENGVSTDTWLAHQLEYYNHTYNLAQKESHQEKVDEGIAGNDDSHTLLDSFCFYGKEYTISARNRPSHQYS